MTVKLSELLGMMQYVSMKMFHLKEKESFLSPRVIF